MLLEQSARPVSGREPLTGKTVYIPPMAYGSARAFAAGFRALGVDAHITPPSDAQTRELGARYTCGDECYPAKVTVGDFMKVLAAPDAKPERVVFFMPTADGPCRFGQYSAYLRKLLDLNGFHQTGVLSPTSRNSYEGLGELSRPFVRTSWRMLSAAEILERLRLRHRPYELLKGSTDKVYEASLNDLCSTAENAPLAPGVQLKALCDSLVRARARFRALETVRRRDLPLIAVVGEIFCRLNTFSNDDLIRRLEEFGAEVELSGITEWVWYTVAEQFRVLRLMGKRFSKAALGAWIRKRVQLADERALLAPFHEEFGGREEPDVEVVLEKARPYLPAEGALGEMVLSVGKAAWIAGHGADGVIDISPFTCMNGIVSEAIYPRVSRDHGGIPIRNFYFDGAQSDLDRDLGVYIELARSYRKRRLNNA